MVKLKLAFMEWFFYNLVILIKLYKIQYLFRQSSVISEKNRLFFWKFENFDELQQARSSIFLAEILPLKIPTMIVKCSRTLFISRGLYNNIVIRTYITRTKYDYDKKERLLLMLLSRTLFHGFFLFKYIHWNKKIHPGFRFLKHNKSFFLWKNKKFYQGFQKYNKFVVVEFFYF